METIDQAIKDLQDPTKSKEAKELALQTIQNAKTNPGFTEAGMKRILEISTSDPHGLNLILSYMQLLDENLQLLSATLDVASASLVHQFLEFFIDNRADLLAVRPLMNKFAVIYNRLVYVQFPQHWPNAFGLLLARASDELHTRLLLVVLKTFNEEFAENLGFATAEQLKRSTELKDAMRETTLQPAFQVFQRVFAQGQRGLFTDTLGVVATFTEWAPIELTFSLVPAILSVMGEPDFQVSALRCVERILAKKMPSEEKAAVINNLNILPSVHEFNIQNYDLNLSDVPKALANLLNTLGNQLLMLPDNEYLQVTLEKALQCLDTEDPEVSKAVFSFIASYIQQLRHKEQLEQPVPLNAQEIANINKICVTLMQRSQLPSSFEHVGAENSDEEDQFYKYRKELADLFKRLLQVPSTKEPVLDYLIEVIGRVLENLAGTAREHIEVALFLLFQYGECLTQISTILVTENKYSSLLQLVFQSALKHSQEPVVIKQYFELGIRYATFFDSAAHAPLLVNLLEPIFAHIHSPNTDLAKHSIYMFYRLALKIPGLLVPCSTTIIQSVIQRLSAGVDSESQRYLYKGVGHIVCNARFEGQSPALEELASLILKTVTPQAIEHICDVIGGFGKRVQAGIGETIKKILFGVLQATPQEINSDWYKALILLSNRAIEALCEDSAAIVKPMLEFLLPKCFALGPDLYMNLLIQVTNKLQSHCTAAFSTPLVAGLVQNCIQAFPKPIETISDRATEMIGLRRTFTYMLDAFVTQNVDFGCIQLAEPLIAFLGDLTLNFIESSSLKYAAKVIRKLVDAYKSTQVGEFLIQQAFAITVSAIQQFNFNLASPEAGFLCQELVHIHGVILLALSAKNMHEAFLNELASKLGTPQAAAYSKALLDSGPVLANEQANRAEFNHRLSELKAGLVEVIKSLRGV